MTLSVTHKATRVTVLSLQMKEKKTTEEITEMEMTNKQCAIINAAQLPISFSPTKESPNSWIHSRNLYVNDN